MLFTKREIHNPHDSYSIVEVTRDSDRACCWTSNSDNFWIFLFIMVHGATMSFEVTVVHHSQKFTSCTRRPKNPTRSHSYKELCRRKCTGNGGIHKTPLKKYEEPTDGNFPDATQMTLKLLKSSSEDQNVRNTEEDEEQEMYKITGGHRSISGNFTKVATHIATWSVLPSDH